MEGVNTALAQNNLPVRLQQIRWQEIVVVSRKTRPIAQQGVRYLLLPVGTVNAVVESTTAVVVRVNLSSRDY